MSKQKKQHTGLHRVLLVLTSILLEVPDASGTGADLSEKALKNFSKY